jgi:hypothetical protein
LPPASAPQYVWPAGQTHLPFEQTSVSGQAIPHPPQFFLSVAVSTHIRGAPHIISVAMLPPQGMHAPPTQVAAKPHWMPQPPQLVLSLFMSTQAPVVPLSPPPEPPPQTFWPVGHAQALFTHVEPVGHPTLHPPQLTGSLVV